MLKLAGVITYDSDKYGMIGTCNYYEEEREGKAFPWVWVQTPDGWCKKPYSHWSNAMEFGREAILGIFKRETQRK